MKNQTLMGLARTISVNSISIDGKEIVIQETTGAYSAINTGGFGTPNPAIADAVSVYLLAQRYDESIYYLGGKTDSDEITAVLGGSSYTLTTLDLGKSTKVAFPDGVLVVSSFMLMDAVTAEYASDNSISGDNLTAVLAADAIAVMDSEGIPTFHYLNTDKTNTSTLVNLVTELADDEFTEVHPVYVAYAFKLNQTYGEGLLTTRIGEYAELNDPCLETESELMSLFFQKLAAEVKFSQNNYSAADELASCLAPKTILLSCRT